ncbi:kinase-like protein [Sodiomyces alkalinus F11]|uniref:Kinase-like protein n=1 Tax=Sodiomyces alkalinus (strain CBS 110278 / VKM F-3762 / F11) TaxID=1314773 RepID=A0A3N2PZK9_SODAK|nr:kinase-like protein [Sodiomyces alkalinus F11]ROT39961.1 kinase-like protein [Sodiomyces alkalinus F11]
MLDFIAQTRIRKARHHFIKEIKKDAVLRLASSHRNGDECDFFRPPTRGSFNMCYFVRFRDGEAWVVRIPIQPYLSFEAQQKIEREVATMRLVSERTTIPLPRIIASSLDGGVCEIPSFLILEYVQGTALSDIKIIKLEPSERTVLQEELASIYAQLRRLTFPSIGALSFASGGDVEVAQGPVSIEFNMQDLEGIEPWKIRDFRGRQGIMSSATSYVLSLLDIMQNAFERSPASIGDEEDGCMTLYYLARFRSFIEGWLDKALDEGPFVLSHGDLFDRNIIIDDSMRIVAVLDWEWAQVVPLQLFTPPRWLLVQSLKVITAREYYQWHVEGLEGFYDLLQRKEMQLYGNTLLFDNWAQAHHNGAFAAAAALSEMDLEAVVSFGYRYLDDAQMSKDAIDCFMAADPARCELIARKVREGEIYDEEVARLNPDDRSNNLSDSFSVTEPNQLQEAEETSMSETNLVTTASTVRKKA